MNWNATLYDGEHEFVSRYGRGLIEVLNPKAGEKILDIGCGTGDLTHQLFLMGCEVTGIDASESMIGKAKEKFPDIRFICADACRFELNEKFDAVFSNAVLHWIKDQEAMLQSVYTHLKRGGRFVAELGARGNVEKIRTTLKNTLREHGFTEQADISNWYFPSVAEYANKLEQHGFEIRLMEGYERPTILQSSEKGIVNWLEMFGSAFFRGIRDTEKVKILNEVQDKLKKDLYQEDFWIADYKRLRFWTTKERG